MVHATQEPTCPWSPGAGAYWRRSTLAGMTEKMPAPKRGKALAATRLVGGTYPPTGCGSPRAAPFDGGATEPCWTGAAFPGGAGAAEAFNAAADAPRGAAAGAGAAAAAGAGAMPTSTA